ncbi:hypothetical protein A0H81_05484 [Grifola frondosa]|uniref:Uncharacterized protein n=1 Tax=Grifola frondosa TaxID=5627 RepID=A0A1C7MD16_GRIFR|nr:hypothetical protein A0H81_05484 [Grifola frondosa]
MSHICRARSHDGFPPPCRIRKPPQSNGHVPLCSENLYSPYLKPIRRNRNVIIKQPDDGLPASNYLYSEPRPAPKPQPLGNIPLIFLFTTCTLCTIFLLWRRASTLRTVVAHQLNTWSGGESAIRLSIDDGPSAREFLDDDYDDDSERLADDEPLAMTAKRLARAGGVSPKGGSSTEPAESPSPPGPPKT